MSNQKGDVPMSKRQSVLVDARQEEWLRMQAYKQRRSIAEIIRMLIDDAIAQRWGE